MLKRFYIILNAPYRGNLNPAMAFHLLVIAVFAVLSFRAQAFSNTVPVVAWSSQSPGALGHLPHSLSPSTHATVLGDLFHGSEICEYDAIVIVDQPGLHASDLRAIHHNSMLAETLVSAPTTRQFPYVRTSSGTALSHLAKSVSDRCGASVVHVAAGSHATAPVSASKYVIRITLPPLDGSAATRRINMAEGESHLFTSLAAITSGHPRYLVVLTGSPHHTQPRILRSVFDASESPKPRKTGILAHYQLLTPGLILSLLVTFFILVPLIFLGISALSSIQSPLRMETPKGYSAQDKKNQ